MPTPLVSYDLRRPGQDYSALIECLKDMDGSWHHLDRLISTRTRPARSARSCTACLDGKRRAPRHGRHRRQRRLGRVQRALADGSSRTSQLAQPVLGRPPATTALDFSACPHHGPVLKGLPVTRTSLGRISEPAATTVHHARRRLPDRTQPGIADARLLPDDQFAASWSAIILGDDVKDRLLRTTVAAFQVRQRIAFDTLPMHGITLLTGPPGVGKTSVARGLADRIARAIPGAAWAYIEVDPHGLASSALGRSQRAVETLFGTVLSELVAEGPLVVLLDEVETLLTDRAALSMEANPIDVHRAVDAALVGLDRLAREYPSLIVLATSNFPGAIDPALASRADQVIAVPLPDEQARRRILIDAVTALADAFPGAAELTRPDVIDAAARHSAGLDGRRIRKAVAAAGGRNPNAAGDPNGTRPQDLVAELNDIAATIT